LTEPPGLIAAAIGDAAAAAGEAAAAGDPAAAGEAAAAGAAGAAAGLLGASVGLAVGAVGAQATTNAVANISNREARRPLCALRPNGTLVNDIPSLLLSG